MFYVVMEVTKLEPNKKVGWKCVEAGNENHKEWEGTKVIWEIEDGGNNTNLNMIHKDGLLKVNYSKVALMAGTIMQERA